MDGQDKRKNASGSRQAGSNIQSRDDAERGKLVFSLLAARWSSVFPGHPASVSSYPLDAFEASWKYHDEDDDDDIESDIEKKTPYAVASKTKVKRRSLVFRTNEPTTNDDATISSRPRKNSTWLKFRIPDVSFQERTKDNRLKG